MDKSVVVLEGKDKEKLIEEGLKKLNRRLNEVNIEVLQEGRSIGGISIKKYKIKMEVKKNSEKENENNMLNNLDYVIKDISDYEILYKEDGVYLFIRDNIKNKLDILPDIFSDIKRREIENCNLKLIEEELKLNNSSFIKFAPPQTEKLIDGGIDIFISPDKMEGYIILYPPIGGNDISFDSALKKINEKIKYGLDINKLRNIIDKRIYGKKICIAKGKKPIDGKDGYIHYKFNTKTNFTPKINEDGSVDFRNLGLIVNVKKGDILAEIINPQKGEDGFNVVGEKIPHKVGKKTIPKYGKNVIITNDGLYLVSEIDGQVLLEGNKVIVKEIYEVKGDVDNSTGNIVFNGTIRIDGCVRTGFSLEAKGDIEVKGVVEGAKINSDGNIILNSGIQGYNKANINSRGNVIAKYIENSVINCEGIVTTDAIMHSEVYSNDCINVEGKKGLIVGGTCRATNEINAKTIGSSMATVTNIEVGIDPGLKIKYEELSNKSKEINNSLDKIEKSVKVLDRLAKANKLDKKKQDLYLKLINTKKQLLIRNNILIREKAELSKRIDKLSNGKVRVKNTIYPGVKITVGKNSMFVREELKNCTIYNERNEIKIGPYDL